jgi:hypothetical protein
LTSSLLETSQIQTSKLRNFYYYLPCTYQNHIHNAMDSLGGMSVNDPKTQIMRQVQQEAAMQNARMLVEVWPPFSTLSNSYPPHFQYPTLYLRTDWIPETQRTLLRTLRPQTRDLTLQRRRDVLHKLHGEVHELMEYRVKAVCGADTERESGWGWTGGHLGAEWERDELDIRVALGICLRHWRGTCMIWYNDEKRPSSHDIRLAALCTKCTV